MHGHMATMYFSLVIRTECWALLTKCTVLLCRTRMRLTTLR